MARVSELVAIINGLIRAVLAVVILGAIGYGGWLVYRGHQVNPELEAKQKQLGIIQAELTALKREFSDKSRLISEKDQQIHEQAMHLRDVNQQLAEGQRRIDQLQTAIHLLKVDHRLAQITVVHQQTDAESGQVHSEIEFIEMNDRGAPIDDPRKFRIEGDMVYVDCWIVKFDDSYVERAEVDRSTSICLFHRIFGESQQPRDGYVLDKVGSRPTAYSRGGQISDFEKSIWDDFWNIANDPEKAHRLGIRAAHGEAVATRLRPGKKYRVLLRASGGLSITPAEAAPAPPSRPEA